MLIPNNHPGPTQQSFLMRLLALRDERELPESLRLEFTRSLGPALVPFLFGGSVAIVQLEVWKFGFGIVSHSGIPT